MPGPHISILTPAYNAARFLPALMATVAAQDYGCFEHIVIDDGSTDATADLLQKASSAYPLRWYSRPNQGQYATQNELIGLAQGDVITFICGDDLYAGRGTLSLVAGQFQAAPDLDVVFGRTPRLVMARDAAYSFDPDFPGWMARPLMRYAPCVQHCSVFVRAGLVRRKNLYFDPSYKQRGDWDWLIRLFAATDRTRHIPEQLSYWRLHSGQTSMTGDSGGPETARLCSLHGINPQVAAWAQRASFVHAQMVHAGSILRREGLLELLRKSAAACRRLGVIPAAGVNV